MGRQEFRSDERFVRRAIDLAALARIEGEDPFGAVLVRDERIVFEARDSTIADTDPTAHAELRAIRGYCRQLGAPTLEGHTLYASTEPCAMCAGAIHWARLARVVFSVPQSALQAMTGGAAKLDAATIVNAGRRAIPIVGGVVLAEGLKVFDGHIWRSKAVRASERRG